MFLSAGRIPSLQGQQPQVAERKNSVRLPWQEHKEKCCLSPDVPNSNTPRLPCMGVQHVFPRKGPGAVARRAHLRGLVEAHTSTAAAAAATASWLAQVAAPGAAATW